MGTGLAGKTHPRRLKLLPSLQSQLCLQHVPLPVPPAVRMLQLLLKQQSQRRERQQRCCGGQRPAATHNGADVDASSVLSVHCPQPVTWTHSQQIRAVRVPPGCRDPAALQCPLALEKQSRQMRQVLQRQLWHIVVDHPLTWHRFLVISLRSSLASRIRSSIIRVLFWGTPVR